MAIPVWLIADLRSDHAGEAGAVAIYRGALAVARSAEWQRSIQNHLRTERRHLAVMETLLPAPHRSDVLFLWRGAGWMLGFCSALLGRNAYDLTVFAVESFVNHHYGGQIRRLREDGRFRDLERILDELRRDEVRHRDESAERLKSIGVIARLWSALVSGGSAAAVALARRL